MLHNHTIASSALAVCILFKRGQWQHIHKGNTTVLMQERKKVGFVKGNLNNLSNFTHGSLRPSVGLGPNK